MLKWRFTRQLIDDAPEWPGVYVLWDGACPIAVGGALGGEDTIRSRLATHLRHFESCAIPMPTHYSWEISMQAAKRAAEVIRDLHLTHAEAESKPKPTPAHERRTASPDESESSASGQ